MSSKHIGRNGRDKDTLQQNINNSANEQRNPDAATNILLRAFHIASHINNSLESVKRKDNP